MRIKGTCKFFDTAKGWGFINPDDEPELDVFVHYRSIHEDGFKNLAPGDRVEFLKVKTDKGFSAAEVVKEEDDEDKTGEKNADRFTSNQVTE